MTAPAELEDVGPDMPVLELLRKAHYFWLAAKAAECLSSIAALEPGLDVLLDRLLEEQPRLRWTWDA